MPPRTQRKGKNNKNLQHPLSIDLLFVRDAPTSKAECVTGRGTKLLWDVRTMPAYVKDKREEWLIRRLQQISQDPLQTEKLAIEYAYYDVDTTESATKPMVVHADAGYHRALSECAAIAPGCMCTNLLC